jgi:hypothetical protein
MADNNCPLWVMMDAEAYYKKGKYLIKNARAMAFLKLFELMGPLIEDFMNGVLDLEGMFNALTDMLDALIASVSPESWMLYAAQNNANDAKAALSDEIGMLSTILTNLENLKRLSPKGKDDKKQEALEQLSKTIWDIVMNGRKNLEKAYTSTDIKEQIEQVKSGKMSLDSAYSLLQGEQVPRENQLKIFSDIKTLQTQVDASIELAATTGFFEPIGDTRDGMAIKKDDDYVSPFSWEGFRVAISKGAKKIDIGNRLELFKLYADIVNRYIGVDFSDEISILEEELSDQQEANADTSIEYPDTTSGQMMAGFKNSIIYSKDIISNSGTAIQGLLLPNTIGAIGIDKTGDINAPKLIKKITTGFLSPSGAWEKLKTKFIADIMSMGWDSEGGNDVVPSIVGGVGAAVGSMLQTAVTNDTVFAAQSKVDASIEMFKSIADGLTKTGGRKSTSHDSISEDVRAIITSKRNLFIEPELEPKRGRHYKGGWYIKDDFAKISRRIQLKSAINDVNKLMSGKIENAERDAVANTFKKKLKEVNGTIKGLDGDIHGFNYGELHARKGELYDALLTAYSGDVTEYTSAGAKKSVDLVDTISTYYDWTKQDMDSALARIGLQVVSQLSGIGGTITIIDKDIAIIKLRIAILKAKRSALMQLPLYSDPKIEKIMGLLDDAGLNDLMAVLNSGAFFMENLNSALALVGNLAAFMDMWFECLSSPCLDSKNKRVISKFIAKWTKVIKKKIREIVSKIISAVLSWVGFSYDGIESVLKWKKWIDGIMAWIDEKTQLDDVKGLCEDLAESNSSLLNKLAPFGEETENTQLRVGENPSVMSNRLTDIISLG